MSQRTPARSNGRFRPHPWLAGGHRQTILGFCVRRHLRWPHPTEDRVVDTGDGARLLLRAAWQPGPRSAHPALVIVHGLGGCDLSPYVLSTGRLAFARGWHVVRMNMRGCGDGEAICPLLYNAGLDTDLLATVETVAAAVPRVGVVGFSLGGNLALLALGRRQERLPAALAAVIAVCPPLDLSTCADALERPSNRLYQRHFVAMLVDGYRRRRTRRPDLFEASRERGIRTVREFDDRITAPYGGYGGAAEYYARSSAGPHLLAIERPALVVAAADDPMVPVESVARWPASPAVVREIETTGGHVGFVGRSTAPGFFWAPERALGFLEEHL
jgi:predicted alpha/beta-fold hydrolase